MHGRLSVNGRAAMPGSPIRRNRVAPPERGMVDSRQGSGRCLGRSALGGGVALRIAPDALTRLSNHGQMISILL